MSNAELAQHLQDLRDFLIIAGYEESHAFRYTHIARTIENMAEPVEQMRKEGRLTEIPQVGKLIALYIKEILDTGVSSKQGDWEEHAPFSVVEMCRVKGLGPTTAQILFKGCDIKNLAELKEAIRSGKVDGLLSQRLREEALKTTLD